MNKYLIASITATSLLFIGYLVSTYILGLFTSNVFALYMMFFGIVGCIATCIIALAYGAKGIKDTTNRGQSIATVIVSGFGMTFGTIAFLTYAIYIVLSFINA